MPRSRCGAESKRDAWHHAEHLPRDQLARALGVVLGHPERDLAAAEVGLGREAHVVDVDPCAAEGEGEIGDHAGAVGHDDADLAQRAAGHADVQQRAALRAGGRLPGLQRRPSPAASSARASASSVDRRVERRRGPRRGWRRRSPPTAAGWRRRRASRRETIGPTTGIASSPSARVACATSALATTCGTCENGGHQAVVVGVADDRRDGADAGDEAVQALQQDALAVGARREVPGGAGEEIGARVLDARDLGARERVAADVARRLDAPRPARAWSSRRRSPRRRRRARTPRRSAAPAPATGAATSATSAGAERLGGIVDRDVHDAALQRQLPHAAGRGQSR